MKVLVGAAVLMSALATGGIPVVMSTVAQTDAAVEEIRAEQSVRAGSADDRTDAPSDDASEGPSDDASEGPADDAAEEAAELAERLAEERAEARAEAREKRAAKDKARSADKGSVKGWDKGWATSGGRDKSAGKPGFGPPEHARSIHNRGESMPGRSGRNDPGLGRLHGKAMRAWAACVSEQPGKDVEGFDPEAACGEKPTPPGHLKHGPASPKR